MSFALCVLLGCVFLCTEQERFIGNLDLDNETGVFFMPNRVLARAHVFVLVIFWLAHLCDADITLQSWLALACASMAIARLKAWHFAPLWHNPYVIFYYLGLLLFALSFIGIAWGCWTPTSYATAVQGVMGLTLYWAMLTLCWWRCWFYH
ncbi:hypothetical protein [Pasteurella sp. PK-2025]|uniref:hypothetical protein n=1 Tax=unclassified Pasteurella TaxID=2621516 RepID=UPI003C76CE94